MMYLRILNSVLMLVVIIETSTVPSHVARYSRSHRLGKGNDKMFVLTLSCVSISHITDFKYILENVIEPF